MAQSFFPVTPVRITTLGVNYNWTDIDVRPFGVPVGATGVILHVDGGYTGAVRDYGIRRNGNGDARNLSFGFGSSHTWAIVGIDANGIFEFHNVALSNHVQLDLLGYTMAGVNFSPSYVNAPLIIPPAGVWTPFNLGPTGLGLIPADAIGVIFEFRDTTPATAFGLRQNGSADNRITNSAGQHSAFSFVVGVDANQTIEAYAGAVNIIFYLHGYITEGATFYLNAPDVTPAGVGAWANLPALPPNSLMGFIEVTSAAGQRYGAERPIGGLGDYWVTAIHNSAFVFCDNNGIMRGIKENAGATFHLTGYAHLTTPIVRTDPATEIT